MDKRTKKFDVFFCIFIEKLLINSGGIFVDCGLESILLKYRVTGNAQILEKALFPKLKLTKDLN